MNGLGQQTSPSSPNQLSERLREVFSTRLTRPVPWRRHQLEQLAQMLRRETKLLTEAMAADLGKPETESWLTDIAAVRRDIDGVARHLDGWARPRPVRVPWQLKPGQAEVVPEPLGAVLVIGPWNYPVRCLVLPLAFAIAAGNTAAVKPSELAPATSAALAEQLPRYLDNEAFAVVEGGAQVAEELVKEHWDHIFFTGSRRVGKLVMSAAAQHTTPVTLELGGKNPAIVDRSADIAVAARRLAWGKFLNAGQTCVAPDYVLVDASVEEQFHSEVVRQILRFYGPDPRTSRDFGRIVNDAHLQRLIGLLRDTKGRVLTGGSSDATARYLAPTVLSSVDWDDPVMSDEIFGPILPVVAFDQLDQALSVLVTKDKPLSLYVYTQDEAVAKKVIAHTSSGSVCVNHNAVQLGVPGLPFGGVGASGMGAYHGKAGFDTFSHSKAVLRRPARWGIPLIYPPYTRARKWLLRKFV
ncbi:MAG: aldehyde dehydrogenase family protein [Acidimicrobiales bacterium]